MLLAASQRRRPLQAREKPECGQGQGQRAWRAVRLCHLRVHGWAEAKLAQR